MDKVHDLVDSLVFLVSYFCICDLLLLSHFSFMCKYMRLSTCPLDCPSQLLKKQTYLPQRDPGGDLLMAVDHCFSIRGQGTVMTGTILQGSLAINDTVEIPALKVYAPEVVHEFWVSNICKQVTHHTAVKSFIETTKLSGGQEFIGSWQTGRDVRVGSEDVSV